MMILNGRFELKEQFDQGGIGAVLIAEDLQNNRQQVVVKVLLEQKDPATKEWVKKHFYDEPNALRKIDHRGVVKLIDSGHMEDDKPFFVMEYVKGKTLRNEINPTNGLDGGFKRAANLIKQLGEAITAAHKVGVYHRDLKPENIMLTEENGEEVIKVIDFGIATVKEAYDEVTKATIFAGSLLYMAPEQVMGEPKKESDIYALGAIAYEMITGKTPFKPDKELYRQQIFQLMEMQKAGLSVMPSKLCPSLPETANQEIIKALAYKREERHREAAEFGDKLSWALLEERKNRKKQKLSSYTVLAIAILVIIVFISRSSIINFAKNKGNDEVSSKANNEMANARSLAYWGMLQRYNNKLKPIGSPIKLSSITGQTYAHKGDGITLHFVGEVPGYLYVFNESVLEESQLGVNDKEPSYNILFPTPNTNKGEAKVGKDEEVVTIEGLFNEQSATEKIWIIWMAKEEHLLTALIKRTRQGEIIGNDAQWLNNYIKAREIHYIKAETDSEKRIMRLKFDGDEMVYAMEIAYVGQ